jgi:hypothetical protein
MVTFTLFQFKTFSKKWWAFTEMGRRRFGVDVAEGLRFAKMLGTGGGNGFSIRPDFGQYGWLGVWESEQYARDFFDKNPLYQTFKQQAEANFTVFAQPVMVHGYWDKQQPFTLSGAYNAQSPVAVLTRATIKTKQLHRFWQYVPKVSQSINQYAEKRIFSVGIGELPLVQQATFSLWQSGDAMMEYAYKNPYHAEVVKKTRELAWYNEELFARFAIVDRVGTEGYEKLFNLNI